MNNILLAFLLTNALFWGLFPHSSHCEVLSQFNNLVGTSFKCPSHLVHLLMGLVFFALAIYVKQKKYLDKTFRLLLRGSPSIYTPPKL